MRKPPRLQSIRLSRKKMRSNHKTRKNTKNYPPFIVLNDTSRELLKLTINLSFLLNGGAITAILALDLQKYVEPFYIFGAGALAAAGAPILFYCSSGICEISSPKLYNNIRYIFILINFISLCLPLSLFIWGGFELQNKLLQ